MADRSFTTTITVDQNPSDVFAAICDVRAWWSQEIAGRAERVGDTFSIISGICTGARSP